jgi:hypothetical protein
MEGAARHHPWITRDKSDVHVSAFYSFSVSDQNGPGIMPLTEFTAGRAARYY